MPMCVTSGGDHPRDSAPEQYTSKEISQRWRAVGDPDSDLTGLDIEPQSHGTDNDVFNHYTNVSKQTPIIISLYRH